MKVYLDMDGVLTNFVDAVGILHGKTELTNNWHEVRRERNLLPEQWDIGPILGLPEEEVWRRISLFGSKFWRYMSVYRWAEELYKEIESLLPESIVLLSSPRTNPSVFSIFLP